MSMSKSAFKSFIMMLAITGCSNAPQTGLYRSVKVNQNWTMNGAISSTLENGDRYLLPYKIVKGELFLLVQKTQSKFYLYVSVEKIPWDEAKLRHILSSDRSIKSLLPNLGAKNFGIKWLDDPLDDVIAKNDSNERQQ